MTIQNSTPKDLKSISDLYNHARVYQRFKGAKVWPEFDESLIKNEIDNKQLWKIVIDDQVACVWSTAFNDPQIWLERNDDQALYIHRIATNPFFRGGNLVTKMVEWAKVYAIKNGKRFIRMDTVGKNEGLINYYQKCGFTFLGMLKLKHTDGLPAHYHDAEVGIFQIQL
jgi:ribosomal protein S18 acetylase RimI-like enzyme